jgi:teichuronic acid exporter
MPVHPHAVIDASGSAQMNVQPAEQLHDLDDGLTPVTTVTRHTESRLDAALVHGIAWTSVMNWLSQAVTWVFTVAIARLLTPADYGLVGMATLYLQFVGVVNDMGLGAAVVTKHALTHHHIAQINSLSLLLGLASFIVSCALAIPVSIFFAVPELRWVVVLMSLSCIVTALRAVPSALLERELQFRSLALMEAVQSIATRVVVLMLALWGLGYWSLAIGMLLGSMLWTAMVLSRRTHSFVFPRLGEIRDALTFSWHLLVSRLSWYAQANGDFLVAGRVFGKELFGAYAMSFAIASAPTEKVTSMVGRVVFPLFSAIQGDPVALRRYLLSLTKGIALITFPLACGLALVADELVLGLLGEPWRAAIVPMRCLAWLTLLQSIFPLLPHILNVTGESRFAMRVGIAAGIAMPLAFIVGSRWGVAGVALVWVTVYPVTTLPLYRRVFKKLELSTTTYLRVLWPALSASILMSVAVWILKYTVLQGFTTLTRMTAEVLTGAAVYVLVTATWHREHLGSFRYAVQMIRGGAAL